MKLLCTRFLSLLLVCLMVCGLGVFASAEAEAAVAGDVNNDGECTVLDVLLVLKSLLNETELDGADMNGDGKISLVDVFRVMRLAISGEAPEVGEEESGTADITVENGTTKDAVSLSGENVSAAVPAGVAVADGTTALTLSVTALDNTNGNITPGETEEAISYDVHIAGVSEANTVPIVVDLGAILPVGQNSGTVALYHIEDGVANKMTQVMTLAELDAHNEFYYYPATGNVFVALATFSEIALVSDTVNAWNGSVDTTWYTEAIKENANETNFTIANADQLAGFGQIVGGMATDIKRDSFKGKTVTLVADINLGDAETNNNANLLFYPIGYYFTTDKNNDGTADDVYSTVYSFEGTFDGAGHTVANFYQNTWEMTGDYNSGYPAGSNYYNDAMGLFGYVVGGDPKADGHTVATVKNLTVKNFSSDGEFAPTGVITAYAKGDVVFENISLFDCNPRTYNTGVAGIVGWDDGGDDDTSAENTHYTFTNITIDNSNTVSALWGSWDVGAAGILGYLGPKSTASFTDCNVAAKLDVNNDVCANYQYYWYRYCGMLIGTVDRTDATGAALDLTGIEAKNCTVNFGDWNDYYYCELVHNSKASYTHDHQFSKLVEVDSVEEMTTTGTNHYVIVNRTGDTPVATCYHYIDGVQHTHASAGEETVNGETVAVEDKTLVNLPFNQIFGGYGWGVKGTQITDDFDISVLGITEGTTTTSSEKFDSKGVTSIQTNTTIAVGDLFSEKADLANPVKIANVQVAVSALNDSGVTAVYAANTSDWTLGTLTFSGTGTATVTIQDYNFCTPTTITVTVAEPIAVDKFAALNPTFTHTIEGGEIVATLGEIFQANENVTINSSAVVVTATGCEYVQNTEDWTQSTLTFTGAGEFTVTITDNNLCNLATATVTVTEPAITDKFAPVFKNTDDYLYRVGNANTVTLGNLFSAANNVTVGTVSIAIETIAGNATGTYTPNANNWTAGTIKFTGTGVVEVTIDDNAYSNELVLNLEVVDAKNITSATGSSGTDIVLLKDVTISADGCVHYTNCTVYGNGFTYDVRGGMNMYASAQGHGIIVINGTTLDNLVITGDVYDTYGAYSNQEDYTSAVDATNSTIQNCYIANCSAPIRANGVTLTDTTLYGGTIANTIISGGTNTFTNVITANYNDGERDVLGFGILIADSAAETTKLILNGTLKQYNFICESDVSLVADSTAQKLFNAMFDSAYSAYHFGTDPVYVNPGILSMASSFDSSDITDNTGNGYEGTTVTYDLGISTANGYLYSIPQEGNSVDNNYDVEADMHYAAVQGDYLPTFTFALGGQTISYEGSTDERYLYGDADQVYALYKEDADPITLDLTALATVYKYGGTNYIVTASCKNSSGNILGTDTTVTLSEVGDYTLIFTVIDDIFYDISGERLNKSVIRTYEVPLNLSIKKIDIKDAVITITSTSIDGTYEAYKPYVVTTEGYYLIFNPLSAISITDYDKSGTGTAVSLNANISSTTVEYVNTTNYAWSGATITITYTDGRILKIVLGAPSSLNSPSTSNGGKTITVTNGEIKSDGYVGTASTGTWPINSYSFKGNSGTTISCSTSVTVNFTAPSSGSGGGSPCVTPDTLVTLADGTQKRIDEVTYADSFLVWDFFKGEYTTAPAVILDNHGFVTVNVVTLNFANGASVNTINGHGFFDVSLNKFVLLDEYNVADYVGHTFLVQAENGFAETTLANYSIEEKYTESLSILTAEYHNCILEGMLTLTPGQVDNSPAYLMPFAVGDDMKYDAEAMAADIETYGLYTYEDFADYITYEQFAALNLQYFKVAVGKGAITFEEILYLLDLHMSPKA